MNRTARIVVTVACGVGALGLLAYVLGPVPVPVDTAQAVRGPMQVTIDEDGTTRARDRYTLASPVAGRLSRIQLREGDEVKPLAVIATILPMPIDPREQAQTRAQVDSLEALQKEADAYVARAEADYEQAERELRRYRDLLEKDVVTRQSFEQTQTAERRASKELSAARFKAQSARSEVERARAGLVAVEAPRTPGNAVNIIAPAASRVLQVLEKSERVVTAGTPLVVLSNPRRLEVVVDLLSADAMRVTPGARMILEGWGGPKPLEARVRMVEPYGFTKVSALGIEEQRVNVIGDFVEGSQGLGDGYRVEARIVTWENRDVLKIPASALFRDGDRWDVFVIEDGRARKRTVGVGHRTGSEAEVTSGLEAGQTVILFPPSTLEEGAQVAPRGNN